MNKASIKIMSPISQKLDEILKAADFTPLEAGRVIDEKGQAVNNLAYMNGAGELVYIFTHELPKAGNVISPHPAVWGRTAVL